MRILVTGAAGYIGSKLVRTLSKLEYVSKIYAFDNFMYDQGAFVYSALSSSKVLSYNSNILNWDSKLINAFIHSDIIIPLAAIVGAPACDKNPELATALNYEWFKKLIGLTNVDKKLIIYPNTNSGYGTTNDICTETTPLNPISLYGQLKTRTEQLLLEHHKNTIVFRLATVFGTSFRNRLDLLINNLTYKGYFDKRIDLFDAQFKRNYIHIDDIVEAFIFAIKNCNKMIGNVYNLGNDKINSTKQELVEYICPLVDCDYYVDMEKTDPDKRNYIVSSEKLYNVGWTPKHGLGQGVLEICKLCSVLPKNRSTRFQATISMYNY